MENHRRAYLHTLAKVCGASFHQASIMLGSNTRASSIINRPEQRTLSAFAAKIISHVFMVAREVECQHALFRDEYQTRFQIRAALESVWRKFADAHAGMNMRLAETRLHLEQGCQHVRFHPRNALTEARRGFNLASHSIFP